MLKRASPRRPAKTPTASLSPVSFFGEDTEGRGVEVAMVPLPELEAIPDEPEIEADPDVLVDRVLALEPETDGAVPEERGKEFGLGPLVAAGVEATAADDCDTDDMVD
jgi:hypothetical protein